MIGKDYFTGYKKKRKQALNKQHYESEIESYLASENQIKKDIDYHNPLPIEQQVPDNFLKGNREKIGEGGIGKVYTYIPRNSTTMQKFVLKQADLEASNLQFRNLKQLESAGLCDYFLCPIRGENGEGGYFYHPTNSNKRYIKLEYLEGYETLSDIADKYTISEEVVEKLTKKMLMIVNIMHKNGMVHGDIKPENIMVEVKNGVVTENVKFIDVGSFVYKKDAIKVSRGFPKTKFDYLRLNTLTPIYIDFSLFLPAFAKKYTLKAYYSQFGIFDVKVDNEFITWQQPIRDNNSMAFGMSISQKLPLKFDFTSFEASSKNTLELVSLLNNHIIPVNYTLDGDSYNTIWQTKYGNVVRNPMPLLQLFFHEFFDFEILKKNDIHAINLTNAELEYMTSETLFTDVSL